MDPTARRETWDIIKGAKKDKIIILTTHYMDEAEMLADRVAIVSRGSLKTCGTTFFLKKKYGMGYYLEFDNHDSRTDEQEEELSLLVQQHVDQSTSEVNEVIAADSFEVNKNEQGNVVYRVPIQFANQFRSLFNEIDGNKEKYGVTNYSIRCSTLEEVFIKIGEEEDKLEDEEFKTSLEGIEILQEFPPRKRSSKCRLNRAHLVMSFQSGWQGGFTIFTLLVAVILALAACLFSTISSANRDPPLNYSDVPKIYETIEPMVLKYNRDD